MDCTFQAEQGKFNYRVGVVIANGRKILVVFTGSNLSVWCRKMEREVLSKPEFRNFATK